MEHPCANCQTTFVVTEEDKAAIAKVAPTIRGVTEDIPPPKLCPPCRQQRRFSFRNDRNYYRNTCHLCKRSQVSIYSPDKGLPVLCEECFWKDDWDPLSFGTDIDWSRSFFEQYGEMRSRLPRLAIFHTQSENSEYTVHSSRNRNCFMCSSLINCEDVHYSDQTFDSRDCFDLCSCIKMELCYECTFCDTCFSSDALDHCSNVSDATLCYDCRGCQNIVGCTGLRNKRNHILNEEASADECSALRKRLHTDRAFREEFTQKFNALSLEVAKRDRWVIQAENCTGTELLQCKDVHQGYDLKDIEGARYAYMCVHSKDLYDCTKVLGEMLYETAAAIDLRFSCFTNLCYQADNMFYCDNCQNSKYSFGCMSLKKHQYCILNKQYSKEEYETLVPKLIEKMRDDGEWGEYFPHYLSAFGYNESKASEWYPMSEDEVRKRGWNFSDYEQPLPDVTKTIQAQKLPGNIADVPDDILQWAITCEKTGKLFKITTQELDFLRRSGLPIPHRTPLQRHFDRTLPYAFWNLYDRTCSKCEKAIRTTYAPDRPEIVYCEECYLAVVY